MSKLLLSFFLLALPLLAVAQQPVYLDDSQPIERRIDDAMSRMTLQEKISVIHAQSKFSSRGVPCLGFPDFWTDDGPHGVRPDVLWDEWEQAGQTNDSCVAFPALTCLAATWNPSLAWHYGRSLGEEALYRGKDMILGPGVNILRTPLGGRNFEYMGEDPYLAATMVVPYVRGLQSNGVAACVKHFALNNDEEYPVKELKGFAKVALQPGESKDVRIVISRQALSFYDEKQGTWTAEPGTFTALVGNASDNITLKKSFTLK